MARPEQTVTPPRETGEAHPTPLGFRLLHRVVDVRPEEVSAMLLAGLYFFCVLCSYFILRPIRDALAVAAGVSKLPWMFAGTLTAMLLCNPLFSTLVVRFPIKRCIAITYQFFAVNLILFYALSRALSGKGEVWLGRAFFVWTSVFNLFVVSVFWCFMADTFRSQQAKRLFGFIGAGGTLGSIIGSAITAVVAHRIDPSHLLLVSAGLLEVAVLIVVSFPRLQSSASHVHQHDAEGVAIGGRIWAGLFAVWRSRYLLGIAAFLVFYTLGSTVLYFEQVDVIGRYFPTHASRTEMLAKMELGAQLFTALTQLFLTGRIIAWIGLPATLAVVPAISALGFSAVAASSMGWMPLLPTFVAFSVLRRGTNFALTNPASEVLFTVVSREDRYKAKSFIETFVYRAGDQLGAWGYAGLAAAGLALTGIAWIAAPMSLVFLGLGVWLGKREERLAA